MTDDQTGFVGFDAVSKSFGAFQAVDDVSLSILKGEFFSLLGPSGCGKTTLLRMLSGLEYPTKGRILVDGVDVSQMAPFRRPTNMVFQSYAIFPHLSVAENIGYGLRPLKLDKSEKARRIGEMLELIGLTGYGDRRPSQISGGQQQRVALARALVLRPKVLLLDEPLSALDRQLRERMQIELRAIQREVGITFVFVTHDQEEGLALSDRIAVMEKGRVIQCATPRSLYERPSSRNVAEFVGAMNFIEGEIVEDRRDSRVLNVRGFGVLALPPSSHCGAAGRAVTLAIRPEWLSVQPSAEGTGRFRMVGHTYFGDRCHLRVIAMDGDLALTVALMNAPELTDGMKFNVNLDLTKALILEHG